MFKRVLKTVFGDPHQKEIKRLTPLVDEVNQLELEISKFTDEKLRQMMTDFKQELADDTVEQRVEVARLKQELVDVSRDERPKVQVRLEQAEKELLNMQNELLDEIQADVFAAVREASVRTTGLRHYDVQIVGGALLNQGKVVEMRTGEGKTLSATMPVTLNALLDNGVHLITVNDYLAKRDCQWMGPIYHFLGFSIAVIQNAGGGGVDKASFKFNPDYHNNDDRFQFLEPITRREAYHCDITYGTNNEYGFDYLRDHMVTKPEQAAQRELFFAIIDEVDNILIDEARTPLIISGQAEESSTYYKDFATHVRFLKASSKESVDDEDEEPDGDYVVDEKGRVTYLTEQGVEKIERRLGIENIYDGEGEAMTPYLDNALRAHALFKLDVDYVVMDGEVIIVDEFTGRLMQGRRYSEGLHQAIEAKEGVEVQNESFTWATITFQNFFRMYDKLAGMTGTAETEAEEFSSIYKLEVTVLPTNVEYLSFRGIYERKSRKENGVEIVTYLNSKNNKLYHKRIDYPDVVYKDPPAKFKALVQEIKQVQESGRPILVGTIAIETSEYLANLLKKQGVKHEVLNAKQHEREATIITQAGRLGMVTIATNMAGRGVDILLGGNADGLARDELRKKQVDLTEIEPERWEKTLAKWTALVAKDREKVKELGGLHVIGTERHDARRIDNQLRGRAGRQGDPGSSRFYVSLQDDLMRRFGGQNVANLMERFGVEDDVPIEAGIVSKSIENAQTKVEGHNFDIRKHLLKYDDVINKQREITYTERRRILSSSNLSNTVQRMINSYISDLVQAFTSSEESDDWDMVALYSSVRSIIQLPPEIISAQWDNLLPEEIEEQLLEYAAKNYEETEQRIGTEPFRRYEKGMMLQTLDSLWVRHLTALDTLRQGIGLRAFGQQDPLVAFQKDAYEMYGQFRASFKEEFVRKFYHSLSVAVVEEAPQPKKLQATHPDADTAGRRMQTETPGAVKQPATPIRVQKIQNRNALCSCGSGKKYKHCHGRSSKRDNNGDGKNSGTVAGQPKSSKRPGSNKKKKRSKLRNR